MRARETLQPLLVLRANAAVTLQIKSGIAETDTELSDARSVESDTKYKQGFDIATAIFGDPAKGAQGNTALGPGSLGIRGTLDAVGQRGFDASVKIHLSRKYQ